MYDRIFLRKFAAMAIGNLMEWFDFSCFGALLDVLAEKFFPASENKSLMFLKALTVFGAGFVMRPLGGIFMGWIGDTLGRKKALEISILLMLLPSFLIGCLPVYDDVGWISAAALVVLRLLQGLAAGGELVGAFLYTLEATDGNTKGFWGGACKSSGNLGTTCGLALVTLLRYTLSRSQLYAWGWRIPFLLGIAFGLLGIYLRSRLKGEAGGDGEEFEQALKNDEIVHSPLRQVIKEYWKELIVLVLVASLWGCSYYTIFIWLVYYLQDPELIGGNGVANAWIINLVSNFILVVCLPIGGWLGDLIGWQISDHEKGNITTMKLAIYLFLITVIPSFIFFTTRNTVFVSIGQILLTFPIAMFGANLPAFMASRFPVSLRFSGVGVGYNIAHATFSSTASIIQTSLVLECLPWHQDQNHHSLRLPYFLIDDPRLYPSYYLICIASISYFALTVGVDWCDRLRSEKTLEELSLIDPVVMERTTSGEKQIFL